MMKNVISLLLALWTFLFLSNELHAFWKKPVSKYNPVKVSGGILASHGSVSWSPDGREVAFIKKKVFIYDTKSRKKRKLKIEHPYYLSWTVDGLFVLHEDNGNHVISKIYNKTFEVRSVVLDFKATAIYESMYDGELVMPSYRTEKIPIGLVEEYAVYTYDAGSDEVEITYRNSRIVFGKAADTRLLKGWTTAGTSPAETEIVFIEYHDPPALEPFLSLIVLDYKTGAINRTVRTDNEVTSRFGNWSPDGRKMAISSERGSLWVLDSNGELNLIDKDMRGRYPSWNPMGSQLFFGGYIIDSDGKNREEIVPNSPESLAIWSPDGTRALVIEGGNLWLLGGFSPRFIYPEKYINNIVKSKILLLKELLLEGFITKEEYAERYRKLFAKTEGTDAQK